MLHSNNKGKNRVSEAANTNPVIIKKYANRRLYNTSTSAYITLEELAKMVREDIDFEVVDAKTGKDLTRPVLAQILFEEETRGASMLPVKFLRQLIGFYDHSMQSILPHYLEASMDVFSQNQQNIQEKMGSMFGAPDLNSSDTSNPMFNPFKNIQNLQQQQMKTMQNMFGMMNPFVPNTTTQPDDTAKLKDEIANLSAEIERLKKK